MDNASHCANPRRPYWEIRDLVTVGVFAALVKALTLLVALIGGGMNPLTLIMKNLLFTSLLLVLLFKVRKFGTLTLFIAVNSVISLLLLGGGVTLIPIMLVAGLLAEAVIVALGGYRRAVNIAVGVALYDLSFKIGSLGVSWLYVREQPNLLWFTVVVVGIGYIGAFAGLFAGLVFIKELRHAGIVRS